MKRSWGFFCLIVWVTTFPQTILHAQRTAGSLSIGGYGGAGILTQPSSLKDYYKQNLGYGGEIDFYLTRMTAVSVTYQSQRFECDREKVRDQFDTIYLHVYKIWDGNATLRYVGINLIQYFTPPHFFIGLYLKIGGGAYQIHYEDFTLKGMAMVEEKALAPDDDGMGLHGGPGLEILLSKQIRLIVEGKYHHVFTSEEVTSCISMRLGLKITLYSF